MPSLPASPIVADAAKPQSRAELLPHIRPLTSKPRLLILGIILLSVVVAGGLLFALFLPGGSSNTTSALHTGSKATGFTLQNYTTAQHSPVHLSDYKGKNVLLNFWSESCVPCRAEAPLLAATYVQYATQQNFVILGVNQNDPPPDIMPFGQGYDIEYPLLLDPTNTVNEAYDVTALPTSYFIDTHGIIRKVVVSQLNQQLLQQNMQTLGVKI